MVNPRRATKAMRGYWWRAVGVGLLSPLFYILVLAELTAGAPFSFVAPMHELSMIVGTLVDELILREKVGRRRLFGCGVLIAGVILLLAT